MPLQDCFPNGLEPLPFPCVPTESRTPSALLRVKSAAKNTLGTNMEQGGFSS